MALTGNGEGVYVCGGWGAREGAGLGWREGLLPDPTPHPPRSLQHPNVLQCLGVCVETLPFLLIMEFCQLVRLCRAGGGGRELKGRGSRLGSQNPGNNIVTITATPCDKH